MSRLMAAQEAGACRSGQGRCSADAFGGEGDGGCRIVYHMPVRTETRCPDGIELMHNEELSRGAHRHARTRTCVSGPNSWPRTNSGGRLASLAWKPSTSEMPLVCGRSSSDMVGPRRTSPGKDGAEAAWLIAQHAIGEPEFQRRALLLIQESAAELCTSVARGLPRRSRRVARGASATLRGPNGSTTPATAGFDPGRSPILMASTNCAPQLGCPACIRFRSWPWIFRPTGRKKAA